MLRKVSLRITALLVRTPVTANQLTGLMIVVGLVAAVPAALAGWWMALVAVLLVQVYFLLDLCDGEVARWRRQTSITGVYLDRVGHYLVEAALLSAYGIRAGGQEWGMWSTLGVLTALCAVLVKAETDLVDVSRARKGESVLADEEVELRSPALGKLRKVASVFKIHQLTGALESSFLLLVAASIDAVAGDLTATRIFAGAMLGDRGRDGGAAPREHPAVAAAVVTTEPAPGGGRRSRPAVDVRGDPHPGRPAGRARGGGRAVRRQLGAAVEIVVVGNGADVPDLPPDVRVLRLAANVGIPAGRNEGVVATTGDVVAFLDDDGLLQGDDASRTWPREFAADPRLGIVSFRIADPDGGPGARRHVPRLRAGDPLRSSDVTTFLGGACAVRRSVFDRVGLLPGDFFYAHEETDLAWRALDAGWRIRYDADVVLCTRPRRRRGTPPTTGSTRATGSGSRGAGCRCCWCPSTSARGPCSPWRARTIRLTTPRPV